MALIYGLSSSVEPEKIRYVGKATNLEKRLKRHLSKYYLKDDTYKNRWIKSELKSGNKIQITLLEEVPDINWQESEIKWIKQLKEQGSDLTNGTDGGEGLFLESNDIVKKRGETRKKNNLEAKKEEIQKFKIIEKNDLWFGERNCVKCNEIIVHSHTNFNELIYLLRKSVNRPGMCCHGKGRKLTDEDKKKISESKENLSQETRNKFSKLHKGKIISDEMKQKLRDANLGKKHSQETKNKMSASRLGKKIKK